MGSIRAEHVNLIYIFQISWPGTSPVAQGLHSDMIHKFGVIGSIWPEKSLMARILLLIGNPCARAPVHCLVLEQLLALRV
jgi:hypothetical protein